MTQHPNTQALVKLAYAYAMYDYQNYAKRHNKNNPVYKRIDVEKEEIDHDQVHTVKEKANKNTYMNTTIFLIIPNYSSILISLSLLV